MNYKTKTRVVVLFMIAIMVLGIIAPALMVSAASGDSTVYLTKTGECYHLDGCASLSRSKIPTTLQDAVNRNYRACSKCNPGLLDTASSAVTPTVPATTTTTAVTPTTVTPSTAAADLIEALKTYKGNNEEFNAYAYYVNNVDLQTAIGADGDKLLKHFTDFGKAEGRKAK